ncbi:MAG: neutral/alkaline non-lysosomal ceramidase N-terminal domain-containing protein [Sedimentisphaerales bacterium]|nr:neutral/alkaline non-lysosomal ceramidase N-terminal domain-containing protein [Sedimentisphaerales bacterium]
MGTAKINITPTIKESMGQFTGVHDDFFIRVIALSDGNKKAALIATELKWIADPLWEDITKRIEEETGIEKEYIFLSAIHTHSNPPARVSSSSSDEVVAYVKELKEKSVTALQDTLTHLKPARIGAGKGECKMNMNRRARTPKGEIWLGKNPYGPCDHEVGVLRIDDEKGHPISIMANWPCHAVVMWPKPTLMTGDWPGAAARFVEKEFDNGIIAPVTIGASGDINPIYMVPESNFHTRLQEMEITGIYVGEEAIRIAKDIRTYPHGRISASQRVLTLPGKKRWKSHIPQENEPGEDFHVRLSALKVGTIVFVGIGGEMMNEIGTNLKERSPYKHTFVITHCNGSCGYIVTDETFKEGGYEVQGSRVMPGTEKILLDNLLEMIHQL